MLANHPRTEFQPDGFKFRFQKWGASHILCVNYRIKIRFYKHSTLCLQTRSAPKSAPGRKNEGGFTRFLYGLIVPSVIRYPPWMSYGSCGFPCKRDRHIRAPLHRHAWNSPTTWKVYFFSRAVGCRQRGSFEPRLSRRCFWDIQQSESRHRSTRRLQPYALCSICLYVVIPVSGCVLLTVSARYT